MSDSTVFHGGRILTLDASDTVATALLVEHGVVVAFGSAYLAVRFLTRYFHAHTLTPFAIYSVFAGVGALVWLGIH